MMIHLFQDLQGFLPQLLFLVPYIFAVMSDLGY
jgi:hypothetical protein